MYSSGEYLVFCGTPAFVSCDCVKLPVDRVFFDHAVVNICECDCNTGLVWTFWMEYVLRIRTVVYPWMPGLTSCFTWIKAIVAFPAQFSLKNKWVLQFQSSLRFPFQWVDVFCEEAFVKAGVSLKEHLCSKMQV